jgi:GcrA cell cycle regulator
MYPKVVALWNKGLTTREMGAELGLTKNAVCGLLKRMRDAGVALKPRTPPASQTPAKKPAVAKTPPNVISLSVIKTTAKAAKETKVVQGIQQVLPFPELAPKPPEPPAAKKQRDGIRFMQLRSSSCRFIISGKEPENFLFCGDPKERGSYCAEHAALCYVPPLSSKSSGKFKLAPMRRA